jgi:hypothetical protein
MMRGLTKTIKSVNNIAFQKRRLNQYNINITIIQIQNNETFVNHIVDTNTMDSEFIQIDPINKVDFQINPTENINQVNIQINLLDKKV